MKQVVVDLQEVKVAMLDYFQKAWHQLTGGSVPVMIWGELDAGLFRFCFSTIASESPAREWEVSLTPEALTPDILDLVVKMAAQKLLRDELTQAREADFRRDRLTGGRSCGSGRSRRVNRSGITTTTWRLG